MKEPESMPLIPVRTMISGGEVVTEYGRRSGKAGVKVQFLTVERGLAVGVLPDWVVLLLLVTTMFRMGRVTADGSVELRRPLWEEAGIITPDRRKKVLDHLASRLPNDVLVLRRGRGRCASVTKGPNWQVASLR